MTKNLFLFALIAVEFLLFLTIIISKILIHKHIFGIIILDMFEISDAFPFKKKGGGFMTKREYSQFIIILLLFFIVITLLFK